MMEKHWWLFGKSVLACAIGAWLGGTLIFWLQSILFGPARADGSAMPDLSLWHYVSVSHLIAALAVIPAFILGLPGQYVLQRFGITNFVATVALGVSLGTLLFPLINMALDTMSDGQGVILGGIGGFVVSSVFWLIRRPDKDGKQETPPPSVSA